MEFFNSAIEVLQTLVVALVGIILIPLRSELFILRTEGGDCRPAHS